MYSVRPFVANPTIIPAWGVAALRQCFEDQVFEFARLVAAEG
jgi:hypothetical protein